MDVSCGLDVDLWGCTCDAGRKERLVILKRAMVVTHTNTLEVTIYLYITKS